MVKQLRAVRKFLFYVVEWLELLVAVLVLVGIAAHLCHITGFWALFGQGDFGDYLMFLFDALIGIELIKLLCRNDLYTMIEVLLFAVTRHLVIQHVHTWEALIGVAAIAILFATRKFLFIHPESYEQMKRRREHLD